MKTKLALSALLLALPLSLHAQNKTTGYTYDALGRLTFVVDSANGNRDYDYDKAGNRVNVAAGTANDGASEATAFTFPAPANPRYSLGYSCAWRANWDVVSGAVKYLVRDTSGSANGFQYVTTNEAWVQCPVGNSLGNKPQSVQACNANNVCGTKAYFN